MKDMVLSQFAVSNNNDNDNNNMVITASNNNMIETCMHLAVSPRGREPPTEPLHLTNDLDFQQIKNDLEFPRN